TQRTERTLRTVTHGLDGPFVPFTTVAHVAANHQKTTKTALRSHPGRVQPPEGRGRFSPVAASRRDQPGGSLCFASRRKLQAAGELGEFQLRATNPALRMRS